MLRGRGMFYNAGSIYWNGVAQVKFKDGSSGASFWFGHATVLVYLGADHKIDHINDHKASSSSIMMPS